MPGQRSVIQSGYTLFTLFLSFLLLLLFLSSVYILKLRTVLSHVLVNYVWMPLVFHKPLFQHNPRSGTEEIPICDVPCCTDRLPQHAHFKASSFATIPIPLSEGQFHRMVTTDLRIRIGP